MDKSSHTVADLYRCRIHLHQFTELPTLLSLSVVVENSGSLPWFCRMSDDFFLGYRVLDAYSKEVLKEGRHKLFAQIVPPGESAQCNFRIQLEELKTVDYLIVVDMVREHAFWFSEVSGQAFELVVGQSG
ncbi:MAG: hypothetical protein KDD62_02555 [Bdellovibrionales bacterium]|nr:hypothetical protein [Bdellovibrionales bacterium]